MADNYPIRTHITEEDKEKGIKEPLQKNTIEKEFIKTKNEWILKARGAGQPFCEACAQAENRKKIREMQAVIQRVGDGENKDVEPGAESGTHDVSECEFYG